MRYARGMLLALLGLGLTAPLAAQAGGTIELGAFGRWSRFGDKLRADVTNKLPAENGLGGGLRLGVFLVKNLELEADASYTKVDAAGGGKVRLIPIHAGLTYNIPLAGKVSFLLGARYVHQMYGEDADFDDNGIGGVAGLRFGPVRIEGTLDYIPKDDPDHGHYANLGVNAGLSLLLGHKCDKSADGVTVTPASATLDRGAKATFTATATRCGKPESVNWTATGGEITQTGEYTAGQTPGSYQVTATEPKSGLSSSAQVTIKEPAPPPPPPPPAATLSRVDLKPDRAKLKLNESVAFTVTGIMSDNSSRTLSNCTLTATGNPTQSGNSFSWSKYGTYTVTAVCDGMRDESTVDVPLEVVIFGANFAFDKDQLTSRGLDSVRAAADSLKKYPELKIRLEGHADFMGSDEYNCNLSWRRVHTVHLALNRFGISNDRIALIEGFGEAYPVPDDQVPQEWKDLNTRTRDKGKWWDRRVIITTASKDPAMTACAEPKR